MYNKILTRQRYMSTLSIHHSMRLRCRAKRSKFKNSNQSPSVSRRVRMPVNIYIHVLYVKIHTFISVFCVLILLYKTYIFCLTMSFYHFSGLQSLYGEVRDPKRCTLQSDRQVLHRILMMFNTCEESRFWY